MTPESVAKKAMDACIQKAKDNPLSFAIDEQGCGPWETSNPAREEAREEFQRLSNLFPRIAAGYEAVELVCLWPACGNPMQPLELETK